MFRKWSNCKYYFSILKTYCKVVTLLKDNGIEKKDTQIHETKLKPRKYLRICEQPSYAKNR